jgi:hypothetical protein
LLRKFEDLRFDFDDAAVFPDDEGEAEFAVFGADGFVNAAEGGSRDLTIGVLRTGASRTVIFSIVMTACWAEKKRQRVLSTNRLE